jgi:hypothetical protein
MVDRAQVLAQLPAAPAPEAILTPLQLRTWLQVSEAQLYRLNLPAIRLGRRTVRYHVGTVLEELKRRAK